MSETTSEKQESGWTEWPALGSPFDSRPMPVEECDEEGCFVIRAELPGVDIEHGLDVYVRGHRLEIRATRGPCETTNEHAARHSEFRYGRFWRVLTLPPGARQSEIEATSRDGILEVRVPVTAATTTADRHIAVQAG